MSAPIKHEENPKDPLLYAPPWVRGQRVRREPQLTDALPPVPATAGAAPADSKINWPPSPAKLSRFEGDVAMSELRQRLSLDPHLVPGPPPRMQRRPVARSWLARLPLYIGLAAIAAYLAFEFNLSSGERTAATNSDTSVVKTARLTAPGEAQPAPQLVVEDRRALAGEPLPLRIVLIGATGGESVFLNGLVKGTRLSAGEPFISTGWRVPARELGNVIA